MSRDAGAKNKSAQAGNKQQKKKLDPRAVEIGALIKARRAELGISTTKFAEMVGISQPTLSLIERGIITKSKFLPEIAEAIGFEVKSFKAIHNSNLLLNGPRDFPVYFMQMDTTGISVVLNTEARKFIERPTALAGVKESFGVCIYGNENNPRYKPGEIVFVHPFEPPVIGKDVLVRPADLNDQHIHVGELKDDTTIEWHIFLYGQKETIKLKKANWDRCHRIIGHTL